MQKPFLTLTLMTTMICNNIDSILENIKNIALKSGRNPDEITLVAVSKKQSAQRIQEAISCGQKVFGENYIQEVQEKKEIIGDRVNFHFIGNLQSNKAHWAARYCCMVETVDRLKIAEMLNKHLLELGKTLDILVQVNIGLEPQKSGVAENEVANLIQSIQGLPQLRLRGLMTIPPFHNNAEDTRPYFANLKKLSNRLISQGILGKNQTALSMGMSSDYHVAIEEGATIVRVGTSIFGERSAQ